MSAAIGSFRMEILDANTNAILKHTVIGNRTYVSGIEGEEFAVRITVYDPTKYMDTLKGDDTLSCSFCFDGSLGGSIILADGVSSTVASETVDSISSPHGMMALIFNSPVIVPFFDVEDASQNIETNKSSDTGTISAKIWSAQLSSKDRVTSTDYTIKATNVNDTKKFFHRPNIGISTGRILAPKNGDSYDVRKSALLAELKVWCQPDGIVTLYEKLERDKIDNQKPVNVNDNLQRACKKEQSVIEDEQKIVDLTDDSSTHTSKKRARQDKSNSSGGNSRSSLTLDLTAETSIIPVVKRESVRLSEKAIHIDLRL